METQELKDKFNELVKLYVEEGSISEQIKLIKDELKESGQNATAIASVAKAYASNKVDALVEKSQELIDVVEAIRS